MNSEKEYSKEQIQEIGRRARELRTLKKISQNELGKKVNVSKHVIYRFEAGLLEKVKDQLVTAIAYHLDCNKDYLLLKTDRPEHPHAFSNVNFRELPEFQKRVEGFIYSNLHFKNDIEYMLNYMHPDYQKEIMQIFHSYITFHKLGVHYPNTNYETAREFKPADIEKEIDENFWSKIAMEREQKEKKESPWIKSTPDNSNVPYWANPELT